MIKISIPYNRAPLTLELEPDCLKAVLETKTYVPANPLTEQELVIQALEHPIGSERLSAMAAGARQVLVITSDHTRPVPSKVTLPILLAEIRKNNPEVKIKILVATGFHRLSRKKELIAKFGEEMFSREDIVIHDCRDKAHLVYKGQLPSDGELWVNDAVDWADLVVAEGFIEPHFFAGFSGGRKSILPGIAAEKTVFANHCARFIASPYARTGNLEHNPLHLDMLFAAQAAGLAFILNVALDADKKIIQAFAGHPELAHRQGCDWVGRLAAVKRVPADIVVTSNSGYPLDQNIYQAVKGMSAGEACVREGGVIIIAAACEDGHGGEAFFRWFAEAKSPQEVTDKIHAIAQQDTLPDQWEAQILARILGKCRVILVSDLCDSQTVCAMFLQHAPDLAAALAMARAQVGELAEIVVIPDGVSVIVSEE
ncbi:MAG TPA: nickel-dependent lactate racemase [Clostridia bacterium]